MAYTAEQIAHAEKVAAVLESLSAGEKNDVFSTTLTNQSLYNVNPGNIDQLGVFTTPGVRPGMFNLTARTRSIASAIPFMSSEIWNEAYDIMTGATQGSAASGNSINTCAAAPTPGVLKTMKRIFQFGMIHMDTPTFDRTKAGGVYNRAVMTRQMYNNAQVNNPFIPQLPGVNGEGAAQNELRAAMYTLGKGIEDAVVKVNMVGSASSQAAADTTYAGIPIQWDGLATQIKTGYADSVSGFPATSVDSDVQTFAAAVGGTDSLGRDLVNAMNDLVYGRRELARKIGLTEPTFAFVMRGDLFREVTRIWAEQLAFYHVTGAAGTPIMGEATYFQQLRQQMQGGNYLMLDDASQVPVIIDDSMPRRPTANNTFQSDILLVALQSGGVQLLHYEFYNMNNAGSAALNGMGSGSAGMVINGGMYYLFRLETGGCVSWKVVARPRLILDAPFLSGRLDRVEYTVLFKNTDAIVGESYYRDGGVSYHTGTSF